MKLSRDFYLKEDVFQISRDLLGKVLYTNIEGEITSGLIVETEAYRAPEDKASHAFGNKKTSRTAPFYLEGGISYVYICYGIHYLFNIVTNKAEIPHAILVRAVEPLTGIEVMLERRKKKVLDKSLTSGPGALSQALGINKVHNSLSLTGDTVWIEDKGTIVQAKDIVSTSRIGVDYAQEYALKPWRYYISGNKWVSKKSV
jgi:DNA-3-methyladenine glycosylase